MHYSTEGLLCLKIESWSQPVQSNSIQLNSVQFKSIQFSSVQFSSVQFSSIQLNSVPFSSVQSSTKISTSLLIQHIVKLFPSFPRHKPGRSPPRFSVFSPSGGPRPAMANVNVNALKTGIFIKLSSHPKWYISLEATVYLIHARSNVHVYIHLFGRLPLLP